MAGADKEEFFPLLPVGFHNMDVAALTRLCVGAFPASITRGRLMGNLGCLIDLINQSRIRGDLWIDGSFLTQKLNPDDVDLIFVVPIAEYQAMDSQQQAFFAWYRNNSLYDQYRCDNFHLIRDSVHPINEFSYAYWLRQFGFSRSDQMKGLAVIKVPFLVTP